MAIDLKEAISIIQSGDWCSIHVLQANVNQGTGGKALVLSKVRISRRSYQPELGHKAAKATAVKREIQRNANHNANFTLNVETQGPNPEIITIHPPLIYKLNNQELL